MRVEVGHCFVASTAILLEEVGFTTTRRKYSELPDDVRVRPEGSEFRRAASKFWLIHWQWMGNPG